MGTGMLFSVWMCSWAMHGGWLLQKLLRVGIFSRHRYTLKSSAGSVVIRPHFITVQNLARIVILIGESGSILDSLECQFQDFFRSGIARSFYCSTSSASSYLGRECTKGFGGFSGSPSNHDPIQVCEPSASSLPPSLHLLLEWLSIPR